MVGVLEANGRIHADVATANYSKPHALPLISQVMFTALDFLLVQRCLPFSGCCVRGC